MEEGVLQLLYLRQFHLTGGLASPQTHQALGQNRYEHNRVNWSPPPYCLQIYSQLVSCLPLPSWSQSSWQSGDTGLGGKSSQW